MWLMEEGLLKTVTGDFYVGIAGEDAGAEVTLTKILDNPDSVAWSIRNWGGLYVFQFNIPVCLFR